VFTSVRSTMTHVPSQASAAPSPDAELRERALVHLKKKRDFFAHLLVYVMVNSLIVVVWAMTSGGFFWPIFPKKEGGPFRRPATTAMYCLPSTE